MNRTLFSLLMLIISIEGNAQYINKSINIIKIIFNYSLIFRPDSNSTQVKRSNFTLITDKGSSVFAEDLFFKQDSLVGSYENLPMNEANMSAFTAQLVHVQKPNFSFSIYKNYLSKSIVFLENVNEVNYSYNNTSIDFNWLVTQDKSIINGYNCQRATTFFGGRSWEVWFTKEIPISDGPYKFCGLPGLIIQANDSKKDYVFSLSAAKQSASDIATSLPLKNIIQTNKKDLTQAKNTYALSIPNRMSTRGTAVSESLIRSYKERIKKNNNLIEIY